MTPMQLGLGSYTFTWAIGVPGHPPARPMTAFDLLEEAARLDVRLVQICDNLPLTQLTTQELDRFTAQAREMRIQVEVGTLGLDPQDLRAHLQFARRFDCPFVRVVADAKGDEPTPEQVVARLRPLLPEFAAAGVRIALENHDRFPSRSLAQMVEQLGTKHAGICLDTVNSFGALEGPEVVVEHLGEFTLCLHVKDFTIRRVSHRMGFVLEGCAAGQGRLDLPWLLGKLAAASQPFNAVLETWVTPGDALDETIRRERAWTEAGVCYLRTLIPD